MGGFAISTEKLKRLPHPACTSVIELGQRARTSEGNIDYAIMFMPNPAKAGEPVDIYYEVSSVAVNFPAVSNDTLFATAKPLVARMKLKPDRLGGEWTNGKVKLTANQDTPSIVPQSSLVLMKVWQPNQNVALEKQPGCQVAAPKF